MYSKASNILFLVTGKELMLKNFRISCHNYMINAKPVEAHSNYIFEQNFCRTVIILKHTVETLREKKAIKISFLDSCNATKLHIKWYSQLKSNLINEFQFKLMINHYLTYYSYSRCFN